MAEVDFSDIDQVKAWLETQSVEMRCAFASRAALRVCANIGWKTDDGNNELALIVFRLTLISAVRGLGRAAEIDRLKRAAHSALYATHSAYSAALSVHSADQAAHSAAHAALSAALSYDHSADHSAHSAALSAYSAALSADQSADHSASAWDAKNPRLVEFFSPLWPDLTPPKEIQKNHEVFLSGMAAEPDIWGFWHDWYLAMWEGRFDDWDLAIEIAKIEDAVWEAGPKAVAERIREIQSQMIKSLDRPKNVPPLEQRKLIEHVKRLIAAPEMTALSAEGAAAMLEQAIKSYMDNAPANCLPEALEHLGHLPALFRQISSIIKEQTSADQKANALALQIEELHCKLAASEAALEVARSKTVHGIFTQNMLKAAGTAFGAGAVGSLGLAVSHFFGQWPDDLTLEHLRGYLTDLETATPNDADTGKLPKPIDV